MASAATLTTLQGRVQNLVMDTGAGIFPTATIQEGVRLALEEYNAHRPQDIIGVRTPSSANKELSLSALTGLLDVRKVWFPYTSATPEDPPRELTDWMIHWDAGVPKLYLGDSAFSPGGADVARIFYVIPHTLNGLDSATTSTFPAIDDGLLVLGGAGYACIARGVDLSETAANMAVTTPNLAAIGEAFLSQFRKRLGADD